MSHSYSKIKIALLVTLFALLTFIFLFPIYALILGSFKPVKELFRSGLNLSLEFDLFTLENYAAMTTKKGLRYFIWFKNSLIITAVQTFLTLFFSSVVGYGLAVYNFKGRNLCFILVLITLMIPTEALLLPLYKLMIDLHLINTYAGVILPVIVLPFAIFFFRQYALSLPTELIEAARVDGCTEYGIFFRIMVPMMTPAYGAMAILVGLFSWNNLLWPMIILNSSKSYTLPIGLVALISPYGNNMALLLSGSILAVIPVLIIYLFMQRYFIEGLTSGSVKG